MRENESTDLLEALQFGPDFAPVVAHFLARDLSVGFAFDGHAQRRTGLSAVLAGRQLREVHRLHADALREVRSAATRQAVKVGA